MKQKCKNYHIFSIQAAVLFGHVLQFSLALDREALSYDSFVDATPDNSYDIPKDERQNRAIRSLPDYIEENVDNLLNTENGLENSKDLDRENLRALTLQNQNKFRILLHILRMAPLATGGRFSIPGFTGTLTKRPFNSWGGKRSTFHSWGGKKRNTAANSIGHFWDKMEDIPLPTMPYRLFRIYNNKDINSQKRTNEQLEDGLIDPTNFDYFDDEEMTGLSNGFKRAKFQPWGGK